LVGTGNGHLFLVGQELNVLKKYRPHLDCISEITITTSFVITVSYDGHVKFLNKSTFEIEHTLNLETPLMSAKEY